MFKEARLFVIIFYALILSAGCGQDHEEQRVDKTALSQALIQEHFRLLNEHGLKNLVNQYSDKAQIMSSDWDGLSIGRPGADQMFHSEFMISPDAKYLIDHMICTDTTVTIEYDVIGLKDASNNGIRYDLRKCSIFRVDHNKITNEATYSNTHFYPHTQ